MRKAAWALLILFVFAIPWEYSLQLGAPLGNMARILGLVALLVALPAVLQAGKMRTPGVIQWLALGLFLWFCCTYFWAMDGTTTLTRLRGYFQEMMVVWLVWEFAEDSEDLRTLLRAWLAGSWMLAILTVLTLALDAGSTGQFRFAPVGQDPNDVARFLDLGFPVAALLYDSEKNWIRRWLALGYLPVGLAGVLLTASRAGFVTAIVALGGCGILLLRKHARQVLKAAFLLPLAGIAVWLAAPPETLRRLGTILDELQHGDLNQRLNIWAAGWRAFAEAPVMGHGVGSFVSAAGLAQGDTAHNTALSILVEGGVVGLIVALAIAAASARAVITLKGSLRIALATLLVVWVTLSMVGTVAEGRTTWLMLAVIALAGRLAAERPEKSAEIYPVGVQMLPEGGIAGRVADAAL